MTRTSPASPTAPAHDGGVRPGTTDHEQVVFCHDPASGLRAVIALHDTRLGPGLGGTRFHPYATLEAAVGDVLRLSRAMSYKNAVAGLSHGGGKAVIIGDPTRDKTPELLEAYGRCVESLGGRYVTACDVGTYVADMDVVSRTTRWATGRSPENGGAGDSSLLTAYGVFQGMRAAAARVWGTPSLAGRRVGIAGVGKVGRRLARHLVDDGATVLVTDVDAAAVGSLCAQLPAVEAVDDVSALVALPLDVYSPCALGGALDAWTVETLTARVICGGANNQLVTEGPAGTAEHLRARGITYCPDYLVNAGGVIQVSDELHGFDSERARRATAAIFDHTSEVLRTADTRGITPAEAADDVAEARMAAGGAHLWMP